MTGGGHLRYLACSTWLSVSGCFTAALLLLSKDSGYLGAGSVCAGDLGGILSQNLCIQKRKKRQEKKKEKRKQGACRVTS
jgi:hypothetical protein